jgi:hypothetical protein
MDQTKPFDDRLGAVNRRQPQEPKQPTIWDGSLGAVNRHPPSHHEKPRYIGKGGIRVHESPDGKTIQISLGEQEQPVQAMQAPVVSSSKRRQAYFTCEITASQEVTVLPGMFTYYEMDSSLDDPPKLKQVNYLIPQTILSGLSDGDKICVIHERDDTKLTGIAAGDTASAGPVTTVWSYSRHGRFGLPSVVVNNDPMDENTGIFFYHFATYHSDDSGQSLIQHHDGIIQAPLVYVPFVT